MMRSLRTQLSLSILLIVLVTVALSSVFSNWFINQEFEDYIARQEQVRSENIVSDLGAQYNGLTRSWNQDFLHTIGMYALYESYIIKIYDADGNLLWDAENHDMSKCWQVMDEISARMEKLKKDGGFVSHTYDIEQGGQKVGSVSITYYGPFFFSENDFLFINTLNIVLLIIGALAGFFSIVVGSLMARRIARPVTKTAYIAKEISEGNYDIRFESETNTRELNDLVTAVNQLADALNEQENLRKRLTTDIAHELRTPLTAVGSHLEAMLEGVWEPTPERLSSCHEEILRLGNLVADLGRLAKVEGDNLKLKKEQADLLEIAKAAFETLEAEGAKKKLVMSVGGESAVVLADRSRMLQVTINLLSNAIKYTPEGGSISVEVSDASGEGHIRVKDNGIGIPQEELPLVFERFYRTDKSRSRKTGGAGIGLTIAKSIVTAHGGTINVSSKVNEGSCFTVTIPKE
ncbi:signal transduction histidine kinase [Kineothrix alysoides]|uniref:histidine kinase n=1 Tax=Kineothrix alysoides TaxID=1469948 RepID=A0A4R1R3L6_9FIRM|nr:HAMP domain-containing sensor histidine kinase [Kineothrix alysoides]TCL59999.1 signal transduction histidine kinase [Kineothrix alysoides]